MDHFKLVSEYKPSGDQPQAIQKLADGILAGQKEQVLMGVTGSGKTFTMANVIEKLQRPALVLSHNKTLAAQLYGEFKRFFPANAVEYFVSYYDYYQPEAYLPTTDITPGRKSISSVAPSGYAGTQSMSSSEERTKLCGSNSSATR